MNPNRILSRTEVLVIVGAAILLFVIVIGLRPARPDRAHARRVKDAAMQRLMANAFLLYADEHNGVLPTPGLHNRLADPDTGVQAPGVTDEVAVVFDEPARDHRSGTDVAAKRRHDGFTVVQRVLGRRLGQRLERENG